MYKLKTHSSHIKVRLIEKIHHRRITVSPGLLSPGQVRY